ncbi:MAG: hypothetical protein LBI28_11905, partial [Treponema sp.]|nr:hypothetical protein [Treponema sp.]
LFVLVSVFPQFFLAFVSGDFSQFSFSSAGHLTSPWIKMVGIVWGASQKRSSRGMGRKGGFYPLFLGAEVRLLVKTCL